MRVLIADDNRAVAATLAEMIRSAAHEVVGIVGSGIDAIQAYDRYLPDVLVMDYLMAGLNGLTACRNILARHPTARVILVSGALGPEDLLPANCGATAILRKPLTLEALAAALFTVSSETRAPHAA